MKLFSCLLALFFLASTAHAHTVLVFDAGSSGTRAYLYDVTNTDGKISVTTLKYYKPSSATTTYTYPVTDPRFAVDPVGYFDHFLTEIEKTAFDHAATPIYVYATAGVRMSEEPSPQQVIEYMRTGIRGAAGDAYPPIANADVDTLTVEEEAYNVWINDQYVSGALDETTLDASALYAAIEMGGASAEVSVLSDEFSEFNRPFSHNGLSYNLYSTGYDGSGQDKARDTLLTVYNEAPLDKDKFAGCFPVGAPYPLDKPVLEGTGNFADCAAFIAAHPVNNYDAQAPKANQYLLTSGFYYTFKILGLADESILLKTTHAALEKAGTAFCATPWTELLTQYPADSFLITYCFNSAFQHDFLEEVGVAADAPLLSVDKYQGKPMTWTLGVAYQK